MPDLLIFSIGVVVTMMTVFAVIQIGKSESQDPAHGTDVSEAQADEHAA